MPLKANYDFLFVGKDDNSFLENYSYDQYDKHGEKSGEIFITLEIQNNPANSEEIGEAVFSTFQEEFFNRVEEEPYERFENSLKLVNDVLDKFKSEKVSGYVGNLNIVIAALVGDTLYITQSGDSEAYLIRKKFVSSVTEGLYEENGVKVFSNIANGALEEGDKVLISSTRLLRYISKTDLGRIMMNDDPAVCLAELRDAVSTEMLGKVGLTAIATQNVADAVVEGGDEMGEESLQETLLDTSSSADKVVSTPFGAEKKSTFSKVLVKAGGVAKGAIGAAFKKTRERKMLKKARSPRDMRTKVSGVGSWFSNFKRGIFGSGFGGGKALLTIALVLIVLIGGVWVMYSKNVQKAEIDALDTKLIDVQNNISEAETKGQYDKEAAGQILEKAQTDAMEVLSSGHFREKASILLKQIEETRDSLDNVKRIEEPTLLADLTEKRSNISALGFVENNDRLFVFEYNALYELVLDQVQDPITIDEEETVIAATDFDDRDSIVFLTKSGKFIEYKEGTLSFMDSEDGAFHKGVAIEDWSNRIYLLDPDSNQLWRYTYKATQDRFGVADQYTSEGDLALAKDFGIDANVWFLNSDGVDKYYGGVKEDLIISKAPFNAFVDPVKMLTDENMVELYVLDSDGRILVFYKDENTGNLVYSNQYVIDGVGEIRDFTVDLNSGRMKVLTATSVYEFDL
ncbi:hypothetical protein HOG17_01755 [Candidatus Peregrinibacteria bacterium]|nr:hypothetical protein [Candidatus Peregrinibacteria bacterium]MBT4148083.1 hypothetical protein [Candidatus Peregrinibacteria bacterium]MBT4365847.1 hypothetical protein [Candidatus Peregrinibacteria bacterium]MBT4456463.1 hypothetical protein [Candidatus Peregrinibacteria bacterium]